MSRGALLVVAFFLLPSVQATLFFHFFCAPIGNTTDCSLPSGPCNFDLCWARAEEAASPNNDTGVVLHLAAGYYSIGSEFKTGGFSQTGGLIVRAMDGLGADDVALADFQAADVPVPEPNVTLEFRDVTFVQTMDNSSSIVISGVDSALTLRRCVFRGIKSFNRSVVTFKSNTVGTLINTAFEDTTISSNYDPASAEFGSMVHLDGTVQFEMSGCAFRNISKNFPGAKGAALFAELTATAAAQVKIANNVFSDLHASDLGSAIYMRNLRVEDSVVLSDNSFLRCSVGYSGTVALFADNAGPLVRQVPRVSMRSAVFTECATTDNQLANYGASAMHVDDVVLEWNQGEIVANVGISTVLLRGSDLSHNATFHNVTWRDNAVQGAAVIATSANPVPLVQLTNALFCNNTSDLAIGYFNGPKNGNGTVVFDVNLFQNSELSKTCLDGLTDWAVNIEGFGVLDCNGGNLISLGPCGTTLPPNMLPPSPPTVAPLPAFFPSSSPTFSSGLTPSSAPTSLPSSAPSSSPSLTPSSVPTSLPSSVPSSSPTLAPTLTPGSPSKSPTTTNPTAMPSATPTNGPSSSPSASPSVAPTAGPSNVPTVSPALTPSSVPSAAPAPTMSPTTSTSPSSSPSSSSSLPSQISGGNVILGTVAIVAPTNISESTVVILGDLSISNAVILDDQSTLNITGAVVIGSGATLAVNAQGRPLDGQQLSLFEAAGGVSGSFESIDVKFEDQRECERVSASPVATGSGSSSSTTASFFTLVVSVDSSACGLPTGAIAGIAVGVFLLAVVFVFIGAAIHRKRTSDLTNAMQREIMMKDLDEMRR